jgi:predicted metal-dependent peptidase
LKPSPELDVLKVAAGRLWSCERWPYIAAGLLALDIVAAPGLGTFAVDRRWHVYVDPEVVNSWSATQIGIVLNHELQHLLRGHADRAGALGVGLPEHRLWNISADAEINDDLFAEVYDQAIGLMPVMPAALGLPAGRLAERYYEVLSRQAPPGSLLEAVGDEGSGVDGIDRHWELATDGGLSERDADLLRRSVASAVVDHSRGAGQVPGGLRRWAEATTGGLVDWRSELAAITRSRAAMVRGLTDYSYQRLPRRSGEWGVLLPGMTSPQIEVAVVLDTSGSVSDLALAHATTEILNICRICSSDGRPVHLVPCDAAAARPRRVFSQTEIIELEGGGGTDMSRGVEACLRLRPRPDVIIVITDGYTPWPSSAPSIPVIVALLDPGSVPSVPAWARAVRIPLQGAT